MPLPSSQAASKGPEVSLSDKLLCVPEAPPFSYLSPLSLFLYSYRWRLSAHFGEHLEQQRLHSMDHAGSLFFFFKEISRAYISPVAQVLDSFPSMPEGPGVIRALGVMAHARNSRPWEVVVY